jgi:hypothetical protein
VLTHRHGRKDAEAMVAEPELVGSGVVLESADHGPQFCLGVLLLSYPPQGSGPAVTNWDWSAVTGYQSLGGTTWGDYTLTGTYDGDTFTMTRPPVPGRPGDGGREESTSSDEFATPCPEPPGGWRVVDPSRTTYEAMETTFAAARRLEGYAGSWMDQSINPASRSHAKNAERLMNDPTRLIINVTVTGDTTAAEAKLRETWGGALCVSPAQHTEAELLHVLDEVTRIPGMLTAWTGRDRVEVEVIYDDGSLQRELDDRLGAGIVAVTSALRPTGG